MNSSRSHGVLSWRTANSSHCLASRPALFLRFDPAGIGLAIGRQRSTIRQGQEAGLKHRRGQPLPFLLRHMIEMGRAGGAGPRAGSVPACSAWAWVYGPPSWPWPDNDLRTRRRRIPAVSLSCPARPDQADLPAPKTFSRPAWSSSISTRAVPPASVTMPSATWAPTSTLQVASGGITEAGQSKLHLYWCLTEIASGGELEQVRALISVDGSGLVTRGDRHRARAGAHDLPPLRCTM